MNRAYILCLLAVGAFAVGLAACGGAPSQPTKSATTTATPNAAAVASPTEEASSTQGSALVAGMQRNADGYIDLPVDQVNELLKNKQFTLVNVHIPYEGELPATDLFIPYDQIQDHQPELPAKDAPIILYCRSGRMSTMAAQILTQLGYTNIYELNGGMQAWQATGYEILDKARQ
jgi:rhodanese-related sulfurtransferase